MKSELKAKLARTFPKIKTIQSGRLFTRQLSRLVDATLISLYDSLHAKLSLEDHLCLVPIGGYGRSELAPYSDIDLLYLHDGKLSNQTLSTVISEINNYLYNNGKEVGHTCRTIQESFDYLDNIQSYHAILDSRFLCGSLPLFLRYQKDFLAKIPKKRLEEYNRWKLDYLEDRIIDSYTPLLLSEPNIKSDALGLRDVHFMYWIERTSEYHLELDHGVFDFFLRGDTLPILNAYDFLLLVRSALHILSDRKNDRLDLNSQAEVAELLGFGSSKELYSIEKLMSVFYRCQKEIYFYLGTYIESKRNNTPLGVTNAFANPDTLYDDIISFFLEAQVSNAKPSRILLNDIRFASNFIDDDFKNSKTVIDSFLTLLQKKSRIGKILTLMHECNILGKLLPEFGACTNFPLFSYHHEYTVDEHTLLILRELDVLIANEWDDPQVQEVFNQCEKIHILALAILVHDAGKVKEGDHSQYGAELAMGIAERFRLSEEDTELFRFLVAEHIIMSELSSKRDIHDPALIQNFAKMFPDVNTLRLLYILTIIDTKSVGKGVLTNWKKEILYLLYQSTMTAFLKMKNPIEEIDRIEQTLESYLSEKEGLEEKIVSAIVKYATDVEPQTYLSFNTPRRIFQHYVQLKEWNHSKEPFRFFFESEPAFVTITIFCHDESKFLLFLCGAISSLGLNLVGMRLYRTSVSDLILQAQITDQFGSGTIAPEQMQRIESQMLLFINGQDDVEEIAQKTAIWDKAIRIPAGMVEELVKISNDLSQSYSVLEIRVPDSIGLVYRILKSLLDFQLKIIFIRISTSADFAYDSFHIQTHDGKKIENSELILSIKEKILEVAQMKQNKGIFEISF
ncbi:[protein-PII] uridylyltransferase [Leptospira ryugenii]|uniref:Bifunctional uridylyltransferase/uridylyl-removing enzyme n=1 Tax=Leptospira ryugenii TaxID=1917863 RepID=A0A2P2E3E8_9LEPT|nr:HD domain-containing protein [Leptospira ryugenii]GBF51408.1 [protein-PII] uridylyltransferase [Leptospira ryugenii]